MQYLYSSEAASELEEAFNYYEDGVPNLGYELLDEVDKVLERLLKFPESAPIYIGQIRRAVLNRFPFSILYSIHRDTLIITALMHQKRWPDYWKDRLID